MKKDFILATFEDDRHVLAATKKARDKNMQIFDIYTPFPVHGLDEAMGIKRSILPYVTLAAGAMGLMVAIALQVYTNAIDWPIIVGGKPFNSIPAFVPISFELTVLFGAHTTVAAFLALNKLYPGKQPHIFHPEQTCHTFIMAFEKNSVNAEEVSKLVKEFGAVEVKEESADVK